MVSVCWGTLPENNVLQFTNWRMYWKLFEQGIKDIDDVNIDPNFKDRDIVIKTAVNKNRTILNKPKIKEFLDSLNFPLYHFDVETFDTAVPIFDKSGPYQKITFQYSLHIQYENGEIKQHEFLSDTSEAPRLKFLESLQKIMGNKGNIVVYNKAFERLVLKNLAIDFPEYAEWIEKILKRIVDLAKPFQQFDYYNPSQKG